MDDETREHLQSLHRSVNLLSEEISFLLAMDQRTLLILIRLAYILERISNKTFNLKEAPSELVPEVPERIEKAFAEIGKYFTEQQEIMRGKREWADNE